MKSLLTLPETYIRPEWREGPTPGRPWWRPYFYRYEPAEGRNVGTLTRRDGVRGEERITAHMGPDSQVQELPGMWSLSECEAYDAEHPLPHPGHRVGQIWLFVWSDDQEFPFFVSDARAREGLDCGYPTFARTLTFSKFLLHDPLRPDLAPWSSR